MVRQEYTIEVKAEKSAADSKKVLYKITFMKEGINYPLSINIANEDSLNDLREILMNVIGKIDNQIEKLSVENHEK